MFSSLPTKHRLVIVGLASLLSVLLLIPSDPAEASKDSEKSSLEIGKRYSLAVPVVTDSLDQNADSTLPQEDNSLEWVSVEVKKGDVLGAVFRKAKIDAVTMQAILDSGKDAKTLTRLFPGEQLEFGLTADGQLQELRYPLNHLSTLRISRNSDGGFTAEELKKELEKPIDTTRYRYQKTTTLNSSPAKTPATKAVSDDQLDNHMPIEASRLLMMQMVY